MVSRRDLAGWLLAGAVRLLPPARREWGAAMRAELVGIRPRWERLQFAVGCARVVARHRTAWRRVGFPVVLLGTGALAVGWTGRVGYAPLRWGLVGLVSTLVVVAWLGQVAPLGPVRPDGAARAARCCGYLLVGTLVVEAVWSIAGKDNRDVSGVPVLTVVFGGYLLGFQASTAQRSAATGRALIAGVAAGAVAAAAFTLAAVAAPPIPANAMRAMLLSTLAMVFAVWVAGRRDGAEARALAATTAGSVAALLIFNVLTVLSAAGPARLIPDLAPAALTAADQLANSRIELQDPYLWLLLFGWFTAVAQCAVALATRRPVPAPAEQAESRAPR